MEAGYKYSCSIEGEEMYFDLFGPIPPVGSIIYGKGSSQDRFQVLSISFSTVSPISLIGTTSEEVVTAVRNFVRVKRIQE